MPSAFATFFAALIAPALLSKSTASASSTSIVADATHDSAPAVSSEKTIDSSLKKRKSPEAKTKPQRNKREKANKAMSLMTKELFVWRSRNPRMDNDRS